MFLCSIIRDCSSWKFCLSRHTNYPPCKSCCKSDSISLSLTDTVSQNLFEPRFASMDYLTIVEIKCRELDFSKGRPVEFHDHREETWLHWPDVLITSERRVWACSRRGRKHGFVRRYHLFQNIFIEANHFFWNILSAPWLLDKHKVACCQRSASSRSTEVASLHTTKKCVLALRSQKSSVCSEISFGADK